MESVASKVYDLEKIIYELSNRVSALELQIKPLTIINYGCTPRTDSIRDIGADIVKAIVGLKQ
jgi:hypothetical protein